MKKLFLLSFITISLLFFQSCKKCETLVFCPSKNQVIDKVVGNDTIRLYVPNAFSPNYDGINDVFLGFGTSITSFHCKIYHDDDLVKTITGIGDFWDGTVNGEILITVYSIKINATTVTGETISFDGTLSAIGGEWQGDNSQHIEEGRHATGKWDNVQTPIQNNNGTFNPDLPNGEFIVTGEVNKCN